MRALGWWPAADAEVVKPQHEHLAGQALAIHRSSISLAELLKLPPAERVEIALALWDSLDEAEVDALLPLTEEQKAELDRRVAEHERDPGSAIPWEDVRRDLLSRE